MWRSERKRYGTASATRIACSRLSQSSVGVLQLCLRIRRTCCLSVGSSFSTTYQTMPRLTQK